MGGPGGFDSKTRTSDRDVSRGGMVGEGRASTWDGASATDASRARYGNVDLLGSQAPATNRRPSLVLTTAPGGEQQEYGYGLALGLDGGAPQLEPIPLSPRLGVRRHYPSDQSCSSPQSPSVEQFSSPLSSPTFNNQATFLSPNLPSSSPTLASSSTFGREPSSPRFSATSLTEPIARLVRRASSSSLTAQLPTSVARSPSPSRSPQLSPTAFSSPSSLSPILGGTSRRGSFAAQAREKEKEKEQEIAARERKAQKAHIRMFSWAERPTDLLRDSPTSTGNTKRRLMYGVALLALVFLLVQFRGGPSSAPGPVARRNLRSRVPGAGLTFIHPDVINRRPPPSKGLLGVPWRWISNALAGTAPPPPRYNPAPPPRARTSGDATPVAHPTPPKKRNLFVPDRPVAYSTHQALPPPPVHDDAPERDTLVLYRILGNDLPPRHSPGQTLRNLRFLLQHESDFSTLSHLGPHLVHHAHSYGSGSKAKVATHTEGGGLRVDKYFVLNRIAEPEMLKAILSLLTRYSVPASRILVIPFKWDEYEHRDFRWDGGVDTLLGWGIGPQDQVALAKAALVKPVVEPSAPGELVDQATLNAKGNLEANGGRNYALEHGRALPHARWILPLDGNSFFTPLAMHSIVQTLSIAGEGDVASRYVIIPMARLLSNQGVLANNSIALVPHAAPHEGTSAADDAASHHRPLTAPDTPEEPQVGFRYDSTESFQEAMRYGRRSKLELLWRLGAIPYSRGLDRRTLPWEQSDRDHITNESWGSIPGAEGTDKSAAVHQPHGDVLLSETPDPARGPFAFAKAGWVYRLFSGDQNQELHTQEAIALRNMNRIKGIVAFLERLDDKVSRGHAGCGPYVPRSKCGFSSKRLWSFETDDVDHLREDFKSGVAVAIDRVETFERQVYGVHAAVRAAFGTPAELSTSDPAVAAMNATLLAMAGYLTANSSYSTLAADLITARFVRQVPMFYRVADQREQLKKYQTGQGAPPVDLSQFAGQGYAFPAPPSEVGEVLSWSAAMGHHSEGADLPSMPFDPLTFDPILLMDAVRLLSSPNAPRSDFAVADSRKAVVNIFTTQLSYLLFNPTATAFSASPPSRKAGAHYDAKVAALAAFIDDARLFVRVANRARLRLSPANRLDGLLHESREIREVHYRLVQGVGRTRLVPYDLAADPVTEGMYHTTEHGADSPFAVLNL
ncbi:hypothetical protein RQP46_005462 [Phenoliferia psychrophenolica]